MLCKIAECEALHLQVKSLSWLRPKLPAHCKVVITTLNSDATYRALSNRPDNRTVAMPLLGDVETRSRVIGEHLAMHCKALDASQLQRIVQCKLSDRYVYNASICPGILYSSGLTEPKQQCQISLDLFTQPN